MDYISRHRKLDPAKKRCEIESRKAIEPRFVIKDGSWFKVVEKATESVYTYFQELPVCQHRGRSWRPTDYPTVRFAVS